MKYFKLLQPLLLALFILPAASYGDGVSGKGVALEDMSPQEFKEALRKSHSEIESRLGPSGTENSTATAQTRDTSFAEKNAYITSAQSRIDRLDYKISALQNHTENWGYAQRDAAKLRSLQLEAMNQLNQIRRSDGSSWQANKRALESILRQTSDY